MVDWLVSLVDLDQVIIWFWLVSLVWFLVRLVWLVGWLINWLDLLGWADNELVCLVVCLGACFGLVG